MVNNICERKSFFILFVYCFCFPDELYLIGCKYCVLIKDDKIVLSTLFLVYDTQFIFFIRL